MIRRERLCDSCGRAILPDTEYVRMESTLLADDTDRRFPGNTATISRIMASIEKDLHPECAVAQGLLDSEGLATLRKAKR